MPLVPPRVAARPSNRSGGNSSVSGRAPQPRPRSTNAAGIHLRRIALALALLGLASIGPLWSLWYVYSPGGVDDDALNAPVDAASFPPAPPNDVAWMLTEEGTRPSAARCREVLRAQLRSSFAAYRKYAWGKDELRAVSGGGLNWYSSGPVALTIVDSLDVLMLAGDEFHDEIDTSIEHIARHFDLARITDRVSFFELTIRLLGGLLSAFHLSGRTPLLLKAIEVGDLLLDGSTDQGARVLPRKFPYLRPNLPRRVLQWFMDRTAGDHGIGVIVFASVQLEFKTLSHFSGDPRYAAAADAWMEQLHAHCRPLCPLHWRADGTPTLDGDTIGVKNADSVPEYVLKQYIMSGRTDARLLQLWERISAPLSAGDPELELFVLPPGGHARDAATGSSGGGVVGGDGAGRGGVPKRWHHLSCYSGAMFALSFHATGNARHLQVARNVTETCIAMLRNTPSGLPREFIDVAPRGAAPSAAILRNTDDGVEYRLRPEIVESLFYMWHVTREERYRDVAWELFTNIHRHLFVPRTGGYTVAADVSRVPVRLADRMESFWIAETLRYLLLTFADDAEAVDLDTTVFSTEGHFMPVRSKASK